MKTKLLAPALFLMSLTFGYGHGPVKIQKTQNPAVFNLTYIGDDYLKVVTVKVTDEKGNVLANRIVKSIKRFSLPLNFANQQFGKYFVTVNAGTQSETQELIYDIPSNRASHRSRSADIISHTSRLKTGQYLVCIPQGQVTMAKITVYDAANNVVFTRIKKARNGAAVLLNTKYLEGITSIEVTDASN
jgi:uncharacterized FlaG/YvyC family protein